MPRRASARLTRLATLCLLSLTAAPAARAQTAGGAPTEATSPRPLRQWGEETLRSIEKELWLPEHGLYAEKRAAGADAPSGPAFMWGAGVELSALAAAAQAEPQRYSAPLRAYADALQVYWTEHDGIGGFDVLPAPKPSDRYYDDNVWIVLALAETFEVTRDPKYRDRAEATFRFVMSGEDEKLGGGIYWKENEKTSKNTCINAPAIVAALRLYQLTGKREYMETARRLYDWTNTRLQDPADGLFWDNVKLDGTVDRKKYSYNTALMIRANSLFHALTSEPRYLAEARRVARSAEGRWVDPATGGIADGGRFAHMLLESFLALHRQDPDPRWPAIVNRALAFVHDHVRDPAGHYASRWDRPQTAALREFMLLDQASAARAYWVAAGAGRR
jgi:mannose/cellobiose epimerase-like protein (N-acyl-D-glucosamine 2-epimerase family)